MLTRPLRGLLRHFPLTRPLVGAELEAETALSTPLLARARVAYAESLGLGFGTGHFYAHDRTGGVAFLEVEGGGAVLAAIGIASAVATGQRSAVGAPSSLSLAVSGVGVSALVVGRVAEAVTAPIAAHRHAMRMVRDAAAAAGGTR